MNHLMTFDITNTQADYSYVMQCITLLENKEFNAVGKILNENMSGKFHRIASDIKLVTPRYFECPQNVSIKETDSINIFKDKKSIYNKYYNMLQSEGLNRNTYDALSTIYYLDEENKSFHLSIPPVLMSHLFINDNTSKTNLSKAIDNNKVFYHIRIIVNSKELYNLQYLGLLLRKHHLLVKKKRISVVLLCNETPLKYYPFCSPIDELEIKKLNENHKLFSRYLRLLAQDNTGVIYAPKYEGNEPIISPMNYADTSVGSNFFPLMEISSNEYLKLFGHSNDKADGELSSEIKKEDLYQPGSTNNKYALFQTGKARFFNADNKKPYEALLAFVAETSWKRLRINWSNNGVFNFNDFSAPMGKIIDKFINEKNNWFTFAIFCFIFGGTDISKNMHVRINESYQIARELSVGLQQLIQNAIQHSEEHSCFFTFFFDEKSKNLKLYVSDINTNDTIISNFQKRLESEKELCQLLHAKKNEEDFDYKSLISGHDSLIDDKNIALRHFFNIFKDDETEEVKNKWKVFRQSDSTAHVGLLIFYQTIVHCRAHLILQSSDQYNTDENGKDIFIHSLDGRINNYEIEHNQSERIIPGTQYLITIPINEWNINNPVGKASISNIGAFSEDYATFAKFIDYKVSELDISQKILDIYEENQNYKIINTDDKFKSQLVWTNFWHKYFSGLKVSKSKDDVYVLRMNSKISEVFSKIDNIEVFLKGFFGALNSRFISNTPIYFAFVDLSPLFLECLRDLCISFANRKFPENVQIFFVDNEYKNHTQIFGNSFVEIINNATSLAIEHGSPLFRYNDITNASRMILNDESKIDNNRQKESLAVDVMPFDAIIPITNKSKETIFDAHLRSLINERMDISGLQGYKLESTHMRLGSKVHIQSFYEMSFLFYRTTIANRIAFKILRSYAKKLRENFDEMNYSISPLLFYSYASYSKAILTSVVEITREYIKKVIVDLLGEEYSEEKHKNLINYAQAQVAFASYQHNLQSETNNDSIQLYFGIPENFSGAKLKKAENYKERLIDLCNTIDVILIVPISSTLTTFDKMFSKLKKHTSFNGYELNLMANYTTLWVHDENNYNSRIEGNILNPSETEKTYWNEANMLEQVIHINKEGKDGLLELATCSQINYFINVKAKWQHPLNCSLCFPDEKELIMEVPLVETDSTSTVPSQQIREEINEVSISNHIVRNGKYHEDNNKRLILLEDCVYYGHIKRSKNHYQYYINSQDFFYKNDVQKDIRKWLIQLKKKNIVSQVPKLKIIFSPEHNTNVGFAQYVNTYYFGGTAEVVSVNEDKVFRSNFICEHEMLRQTIERIHMQQDLFQAEEPIEFYFVDDTINTGATINKANNLLKSLIPKEYSSLYPSFLFKECFVLIDRMSEASKSSYIKSGNISNFHSYVHIDISNMRVHGDSCVGCKLQKDAAKLFKKSASRITASYWANKYQRLQAVDYDDLSNMEKLKEEMHAYERLILSHIIQNYIFNDGILSRKKGEYYDSILFLFETIFNFNPAKDNNKILEKRNFYFYDLLKSLFEYELNHCDKKSLNEAKKSIAELLLKLLSRPFFTFDYSFRVQIQSFLLIIAECYLTCYSNEKEKIIEYNPQINIRERKTKIEIIFNAIPINDPHKGFLREKDRIKNTVEVAKEFISLHQDSPLAISMFLKDVLFEALADMRSTYLLRKRNIIRVNDFVNVFLNDIDISCMCEKKTCNNLLDSTQCQNSTAKKCFWISYIAHLQRIIYCSNDEIKSVWFEFLVLSGKEISSCEGRNYSFNEFAGIDKELLSQEFPVSIELFLITAATEFDTTEKIISTSSTTKYFLNNYYMNREWKKQNDFIDKDREWLELLSKNDTNLTQEDIDKRYQEFLDKLVNYISELNGINKNSINVALLTMGSKVQGRLSVDKIQLVKDNFGNNSIVDHDLKQARYIIKDRIVSVLNHEKYHEQTIDCNETKNVGILTECGYKVVFPKFNNDNIHLEQNELINYSVEHHASGNYRKPYIIILFDNPNKVISNEKLGRKLIPLDPAFLYISLSEDCAKTRSNLPILILQDILAYRNQILKFLTAHFTGNIMVKHATTTQEEAILSHERSASHASTTDEKGVLRVFGLENVSKLKVLNYPIDLKSKEIIDGSTDSHNKNVPVNYYKSAELWLLLQTYVNNQIARLFSRQFNEKDEELIENDGIPALYLSTKDEQLNNIFKRCSKQFGDLNILDNYPKQDNRFKLLKQAATIFCNIKAEEKLYCKIKHGEKKYYNTEYLFCILLDILFTSLKYSTINDSLLPRVDSLIYYKEQEENQKDNEAKIEYKYKGFSSVNCYIFIFKEKNNLIVLNNVKSNRINKNKIDSVNEEIYRRTHDPLDYGDGHMSLFTIKRFIQGIRNEDTNNNDISFKYIKKDILKEKYKSFISDNGYNDIIDSYDVWFETKLPIFEEGNNCE